MVLNITNINILCVPGNKVMNVADYKYYITMYNNCSCYCNGGLRSLYENSVIVDDFGMFEAASLHTERGNRYDSPQFS